MSWRRGLAGLALLCLCLVGLDRAFPPPLERGDILSQWVTDRDGRPLRAFPAEGAYWRFPADLDRIDPAFIEALIAVEDKRFHRHWGVDWLGLARAGVTSLRAGAIVSGGSTITMQTARLLEPRPRTVSAKLAEIIRAHQIEARLSKREILELYLTLAPYGGNLEGIRAASWRYFGAEPDGLSDDQIALLIALPQAPEARRPDRRPAAALAGRDAVARKLVRAGVFTGAQAEDIAALPVLARREPFPDGAWHAAAAARLGAEPGGDIRTTLDGQLQARLEALIGRHGRTLSPEVQASVLVVNIADRAVLASAGSISRERPGGWLDLTAQVRSPGSTLKPFIYGLAFDDGLAIPTTHIRDLPKRFDAYQPENFDRSFRGDVTIAEALQHSLNVPAVLALAEVGPKRFASVLRSSGAAPQISGPLHSEAGLALALGGAGLTAQDLALLYAALGDGGIAKPLAWRQADADIQRDGPGIRLLRTSSASQIVKVLAGTPPPEGRMPGRLTRDAPRPAFKTGTSYGFRDAWAAGVSSGVAIIVWVGRADGAPRPGETGRKAALPLLFQVADLAAQTLARDQGGGTGTNPARHGNGAHQSLAAFDRDDSPPDILFPPSGAELWAGPIDGRPSRGFVFSGRGEGGLSWFVDGQPVPSDAGGAATWRPSRAGFYTVAAVDPAGRTSRVRVRVIGAPPA
ncbi:MAG: penicillin-binding protein 1C [Pseudomonadota bacterium]